MKRLLLYLIILVLGASCGIDNSKVTNNISKDIFTNRYYEWIGEMKIYNNYWVEAYHDTIDSKFIVYFTQHNEIEGLNLIDSLKIDATKNDWIDYGTVMHNGVVDTEIIVKVNQENDSSTYAVIEAWRANIETQRIEPISLDSLTIEKYN